MHHLLSAVAGLLHNIYYFAPSLEYVEELKTKQIFAHLPPELCITEEAKRELIESIEQDELDTLRKDYYRLFVGPGKKLAYPWSSYYSDPENLIFGESETRFREFISSHGIRIQTKGNEPLDHIGLMLAVYSQLLIQHPALASALLKEHISPWCYQFIDRVEVEACTGYFRGASNLLKALLIMAEQELLADSENEA